MDGIPTAYVYFAPAGENFGEPADDGVTPMTTYGWTSSDDGVMRALREYTPITGINYVITTDVDQATFRLLTTINQDIWRALLSAGPGYGTQQGIGVFNLISGGFGTNPDSLLPGGFSYEVILHEFGHAHGIAHPHDTGGGSEVMLGVTGRAGSLGVYDLNQGVYTVMSYNDGWETHPDGDARLSRRPIVRFRLDRRRSARSTSRCSRRATACMPTTPATTSTRSPTPRRRRSLPDDLGHAAGSTRSPIAGPRRADRPARGDARLYADRRRGGVLRAQRLGRLHHRQRRRHRERHGRQRQ